jgi:hypothetical protein
MYLRKDGDLKSGISDVRHFDITRKDALDLTIRPKPNSGRPKEKKEKEREKEERDKEIKR